MEDSVAPLRIEIYVVSEFQTNCYFAINDDTKEVLIIDPGASAEKLAEKVKENKQRMLFDGPIFALNWFQEETPSMFFEDNVYTYSNGL